MSDGEAIDEFLRVYDEGGSTAAVVSALARLADAATGMYGTPVAHFLSVHNGDHSLTDHVEAVRGLREQRQAVDEYTKRGS